MSSRRQKSRIIPFKQGHVVEQGAAPPLKIIIAMPSHGMVPSMFMFDAMNLAGYSTGALKGMAEIAVTINGGTYIHSMRQALAEAAIMADATHMLWMDTDHRFPADALLRLLKHKVPIVGINYAHRKMPVGYVAIKHCGWEGEESKKCLTTEESTGLEEVDALGFGLVLMDMRVFDDIGQPPWFKNYWDDGLHQHVGEDVYFCKLAKDAGHRVFVDHDLSKECAHIGQFEYRTHHAEQWREHFQQEAEDGAGHIQQLQDGGSRLVEPE